MLHNLRLIELFAGYGSQALALKYLDVPFEHYFVCEFDKHAIQSYNDIHGTNFCVSDVRNITAKDLNIVETNKYKYLMTYSFPCTDLSLAGQRKGMQRESGTSSSLLWEVERLIKECDELPQYLLMENVPQVVGKDNIKLFSEWTGFLAKLGYRNYYKVLDAQDYGVPQHRERCFMVSILKSENRDFSFPDPIKLTKSFSKDIKETNVDSSYYLNSAIIEKIKHWNSQQNPLDHILNESMDVCPTLTARGAGEYHAGMQLVEDVKNRFCQSETKIITKDGKIMKKSWKPDSVEDFNDGDIATLNYSTSKGTFNGKRVFTDVSPTLTTHCNALITKDSIKSIRAERLIKTGAIKLGNFVNITYESNQQFDDDISPTLTTRPDCLGYYDTLGIRKITPRECFRLMGVKDEDYDKLTVSVAQQYKQAGNSIVVDVLMAIFENMFVKDCKSNRLF